MARSGHRQLATLLAPGGQRDVAVNELTTVAAAYATAQIAKGSVIAGTPLQLLTASGMAANLVSPVTGRASGVISTSPNGDETNAWRELGTLGNILAACTRAPMSAPACSHLFSLTGMKSGTTWETVRSIALNPARNVRAIFALGQRVRAFTPALRTDQGPSARNPLFRLDAFTLAVKFNATGRTENGAEVCPFGGLGNIAFDLRGYAWITNNVVQGTPNSSNCIVVLRPDGHPSNGANGTPSSPLLGGGVLGQGFGIGFDPTGRVWSGNFGWGGDAYEPTIDGSTPGGSVSLFSSDGKPLSPAFGYPSNVFRVQGTVSDAQGNIWLASYGNNRVQVLPKGDPSTTLPPYADENLEPFDIRLDGQGDAWVSYTKSNALSKLRLTSTGVQRLVTVSLGDKALPKGVAVDSQGNAWVAAGSQNVVHAFTSTGAPLGTFGGGGITGPWGISMDSDDTLWVANFGNLDDTRTKFGVSRLCGANAAKCPAGMKLGDPMTPATGFTLPSGGKEVLLHSGAPLNGPASQVKVFKPLMRETAVQPDAVGNLWTTNNWKPGDLADAKNPGGDGLVIFVGVAAPVAPKLFNGPPNRP
jgi:sugar lactone lactonase YvrE